MTTTRARTAGEVYCVSCGQPISGSAAFCPQCGAAQSPGGQPPPPHYASPPPYNYRPAPYYSNQQRYSVHGRDKWIAAILAFFLGGLGIHKFYLGKPVQGVFYLLFFWTFIPGIIAFIEFIIYLLTPEDVFRAKYPYV
ncbi:MAG: TM2 domain-containing protein [Chloroflexi bacterium]|nr:TM2 domain-containing protein [Chloroflexota bacterium]